MVSEAEAVSVKRPQRGQAMQVHRIVTRFEPIGHGRGPSKGLDIVDIRKLLRTDMSIESIATQLGCTRTTLATFIRQRNICNLTDRRRQSGYNRISGPTDQRSFRAR